MTVEIHLSKPIADLLDILVYGYVVAPSALERYESGDTTLPVGTGPYRVTEVVHGQEIRLQRFDGWHGVAPANDSICFQAGAGCREAPCLAAIGRSPGRKQSGFSSLQGSGGS